MVSTKVASAWQARYLVSRAQLLRPEVIRPSTSLPFFMLSPVKLWRDPTEAEQ